MKIANSVATVILLSLVLLVLGSCGSDDDMCPFPFKYDGEYVLCLTDDKADYHFDSCISVNREESTPNGIYEEGTEVVAVAKIGCSETMFTGWYNDFTEECVSTEFHYSFSLVENTYIHPEARGTLW